MRKRAGAPRFFTWFGFVLLVISGVGAFLYLALAGSFGPELQANIEAVIEANARKYVPDGETLNTLAWLGGIGATTIAAIFSLLTAWHFAEIHLPRRLKEFAEGQQREHLAEQPELIAAARNGLGNIPPRFEESRYTYLRSWLGGWSATERARLLVASLDRLAGEAVALREAADVAQQKQITALILQGVDLESSGETDRAFQAYFSAARINSGEWLSKSIAAGCARRLNRPHDEIELLTLLLRSGELGACPHTRAMALRRTAEVLIRSGRLEDARDKCSAARDVLLSVAADERIRLELGRVNTLFCEIQFAREAYGNLSSRRREMSNAMAGQITAPASEWESGGFEYGEVRAKKIDAEIASALN